MVEIFKGYFGPKFDEDSIRNNFTLVYELLDGKPLDILGLTGLIALGRGSGFWLPTKLLPGSAADLR